MKRSALLLTGLAAISLQALWPLPAAAGGNIEEVAAGKIVNAKWDERMFPIRYKLNQNPGLGFTSATIRPELDAAVAAWEDLPDNTLDFAWGGTTICGADEFCDFAADGENVLIFNPPADPGGFVAAAPCTTLTATKVVTDSSDGITGNGLGIILGDLVTGIKAPVGTYEPGTNVDCDVIFNVFDVTFTTDGTLNTQDIRTITVHEVGHWLSLSHSFQLSATMYPFTDTNEPGDTTGSGATPEPDDASSAGHLYKDENFDTAMATITGTITLEGQPGDGIHVAALSYPDLKMVAARFSISRFMSSTDPVDGADFLAEGGGFYRLDGLPPGQYVIYTEWLDPEDEPWGRLEPRYNLSSANSNVADGGAIGTDARGQLGFLPQRWEFHNFNESADGGSGTAGTAVDHPDAATVFTVAAGDVIPGADIQINMDPDPGKSILERENPTGVQRHDATPGTSLIGGVSLDNDGNEDNYWLVRYPAADLPSPPYNVIEGIWSKNGKADKPFISGLLLADPSDPSLLEPLIWHDPPRLVAGGPNGETGVAELVAVRDRFNVTINQSRDVVFVIGQPESPSTLIAEGYFVIANVTDLTCAGNGDPCTFDPVTGDDDCKGGGPSNVCQGGSGNTFFSTDGLLTFDFFSGSPFDILHRARTETAPALWVTDASPATVTQGDAGQVITITGAGFQDGAQVRFLHPTFGPAEDSGLDVLSTAFVNSATLEVTVNVAGNAPAGILDVEVTNPEVVIPNRARLMETTAGPDNDGDGWANAGDCQQGDPDIWSVPGGVGASVTASQPAAGTVQLDWLPPTEPGGNTVNYNLVSGDAADLRTSGGSQYGSCLQANFAGASGSDAQALSAGQIRFYMVSATNVCGTGTYVTPSGDPLRDADPDNC